MCEDVGGSSNTAQSRAEHRSVSQADIVPRKTACRGGSVDVRWWLTQPPPQVVLDHGEGQSEESQSRRGEERLNCDLLDYIHFIREVNVSPEGR